MIILTVSKKELYANASNSQCEILVNQDGDIVNDDTILLSILNKIISNRKEVKDHDFD